MLEQVSTSVKFLAFYTASKQGKTGLTVTIDIYDPSGSQIVTGGSATALGGGLYAYTLSTNNSAEGEYAAIFKTTDSTVDSQHIPSLWVLGRAGVENLDAATSTRLASSSYTAPANSDVAAIKAKTDNLPSDPADQSLLEAAIAGVTAPSATTIASQVRTELSTELGRLDATVSSRLASASYTAPANSDIAAIKAKTDALPSDPADQSLLEAAIAGVTAPSASTVASAVRSELSSELAKVSALNTDRLAQCSTVATTGSQLAAALS
jgi:hypothetical protein